MALEVKSLINNKPKELKFQHKQMPGLISVIIPVYRDYRGLGETLQSLMDQSLPGGGFEVLVANDGGDVEVERVCSKYRVKMIKIEPNRGSYFARNRALERSRGEFVAFTDANVKVGQDWLESGLEALKRADYAAGQVVIERSKVKNWAQYYDYRTAFPVQKQLEQEKFGPTANLMVKRTVFEQQGGFDQRFRYGGDNEFGNRVYHAGGFKQCYHPDMVVVHPPRSFWSSVEKRRRGMEAMNDRSIYYPERFPRAGGVGFFLATFLPCRVATVLEAVGKKPLSRFIYYFCYCWLLKLLSGTRYFLIKLLTLMKKKETVKTVVSEYDFSEIKK